MSRESKTASSRTEGLTDVAGSRLEPVWVVAENGPDAGLRVLLKEGRLRVGAARPCEILLDDRAVSRQHATLELLPGFVRVRDLGSRNGTRYLGARIEEARVPIGSSVHVGHTTLRFVPELEDAPVSQREELHGLWGVSPSMRRIFAALERAAATDLTVLLLGEAGTGKSAAARALHAASPRAAKPLVTVECASLQAELIDSELFGHAKGAFTGASRDRPGLIEAAHGGSLFLDEVGELPVALQTRLLRVLETQEVRRVGDERIRKVDVRVIAASARDLNADVQAGRFRTDLFFRLSVAPLTLPPLRERREDIPVLARLFAQESSGVAPVFSRATLSALMAARWSGNVRELRNTVERAVKLGDWAATPELSPTRPSGSYHEARQQLLETFERDFIKALLEAHGGNVSAAAREAGLSRMQFYRLLKRT